MKFRNHGPQPRRVLAPGNQGVRREIQSFLRAMHSYPARFAQDPAVTFEQHLSSIVGAREAPSERRN